MLSPLNSNLQAQLAGIYKILNLVDNKFYIGSSKELKKRWYNHKKELRTNRHGNSYLQHAWNKHGEENFTFEVIEFCEINQLIEREQFWIDLYCATDRDRGYNLRPTANSNLGFKFSPESLEKLSKAKKGFKHTEEAKAKMRFKKPAMSERLKGNQWNRGRIYSEEGRLRLQAQPRKFDKWPHLLGIKCKCEECREKFRKIDRERKVKKALNNGI